MNSCIRSITAASMKKSVSPSAVVAPLIAVSLKFDFIFSFISSIRAYKAKVIYLLRSGLPIITGDDLADGAKKVVAAVKGEL